MEFECSSGKENGELDSRLLAKLHAPVKPSCRTIEGAGGNTHIVRFDENGEPGSRDCYTVHRCVCSTAMKRNGGRNVRTEGFEWVSATERRVLTAFVVQAAQGLQYWPSRSKGRFYHLSARVADRSGPAR
jgi:hypothetical protein